MALRRFDIDAGGRRFAFQPATEQKIAFWLDKYPEARKASAVIPLLWLAQKDNAGWLSEPAMRVVADRLEMAYIRVYEVATFYTMFRLKPVGAYHLQLCGTTPCMLRGAEDLKDVCEDAIGPKGSVTSDDKFSWEEVECLGACVNAPMIQINDYYYEDLTPTTLREIIRRFSDGDTPEPGPYVDRVNSEAAGGSSVLSEPELFDGTRNHLAALPNADINIAGLGKTNKTTLIDATGKERTIAGHKPKELLIEPGEEDNLKRISGIGPKNEGQLNMLGIFTFDQIAKWSHDNIKWVEGYLSFAGRITREDWIGQAKQLAAGKSTDFAKRVDKGTVNSSKS